MSKSSPRLSRPGSAGSKRPCMRKELQGNRSCMLRIGERLMRAGSEGNLVQRVPPAKSQPPSAGLTQGFNSRMSAPTLEDKHSAENTGSTSSKDPENSSSSGVVDSSTERLLQKKNPSSSTLFCNPAFSSVPASPRTLPCSSASLSAGSRGSQSDIPVKIKDVEKKKEVFLDVLRQRYPHHAAIIMGHQRHSPQEKVIVRGKTGSTWASVSPPSSGDLALDKEKDPLEIMSDLLPYSDPFMRGCKTRASLPVGRSGGHTGERQHGVVYLQYGEETKQVRMPAEISSQESLRALFVTAFSDQLTMKMLQSPNVAIYIKDTSHNFYYELDDIRNISSHSCLKVYHKDLAHVFNRHTRPAASEGRISKEVLYGSHSPVHTRSSSGRSTLHSLQGSMSPPMVRSMPSSPSRRVYRGGSKEQGAGGFGSATIPRDYLSGAGLTQSLCTNSSSSILERRDVKPDDDACSTKSMALVLRGEGGPHYPVSYCSLVQEGGGRLSIPSSQCSAPPSLVSDLLGDSGGPGIQGSLKQYRASVKPLMGYGETLDHQTRSPHRQKSRKYGESQLPPQGTKTPPTSPQRANEVRLTEGQIVGLESAERISPMHRSLRRGSDGTIEILNRSRGNGLSSSTSSVFVDSPLGTAERLFQGPVTSNSVQSERMKAMEEQIASLAGLVHHALSMGADIPGVKEVFSDPTGCEILNSTHGASPEHQNPAAFIDSFKALPLALQAPPPDRELQQILMSTKRNMCELRMQLNQLRHQQLVNHQSVCSMLHAAGQELLLLMCDHMSQCEEASFRRRAEMEEERMLYLRTEEAVLTQLSELERYVDHLQRSSTSSSGKLSITLRDVEEAAVNLQRVGKALAVLKGEFPELQLKLCCVLRLEVEAMRFLKEEPLKLDAMLRRVRGLTEALSSLRRCVSESTTPVKSAQVEVPLKQVDQGPSKTSPKPQPRSSVRPPLQAPPPSEVSLKSSTSPILVHRIKSTAASGVQPQNLHHLCAPLTPTYRRDSPTVAKVSPHSREGSPALQKRPGPGLESSTEQFGLKLTLTQTETAQRQPPEGSLSKETTTTNQFSTKPGTNTDSLELPRGESSKERIPGQKSDYEQDTAEGTASKQQKEVTANMQRDNRESSHVTSIDTAPSASQPPSVPSLAPHLAPLSSERSHRPQVEKPRRSIVEKDLKQSQDRAGRSTPPPPPPRRFHSAGSGVNTVKSAEEKLTRREPLGAKDEGVKDKEPPVPPHSKPPRQTPEVKPKPFLSAHAATAPPAAASSHRDEEEKKKEEVTKELQETTKLSYKNTPSGRDKGTGPFQTPATAQVTNDNLSEPQVAPVLDGDSSSTAKLKDGHGEAVRERESPELKKDTEKMIQQVTSLNSSTFQEVEKPPSVAPHHVQSVQKKEKRRTTQEKARIKESHTSTTLLQEKKRAYEQDVGQRCSPARAENTEVHLPVALTDTQTVQKKEGLKTPTQQEAMTEEHLQNNSNQTSLEQTQEKAVRESPTDTKSNLMVVVTLQKEDKGNCSEETSPQSEKDNTLNSHQDCPESPSVLKRYPPLTDLTYRESAELQDQEEDKQGSIYRSQYTEDGGSLSPDICNDEGPPPPPPPVGKIHLRISRAKARTSSKEEDLIRTSGCYAQPAAEGDTGEPTPTTVGHEGFEDCNDFDKKPIIVILNEPMDLQSACKRLSTIFESEEDLDKILCPENLVYEEDLQQQGQETDVRKITITDINTSHKHSTENGQSSLPQRLAADNSLDPENQDQAQLGSPSNTETKKKFKFKFPKNKLSAISQAIRSGTKAGKKPLRVVVYEEEEETTSDSRQVMETKKQTKECNRLDINRCNPFPPDECNKETKDPSPVQTRQLKSLRRVEELCKSTFDSINSLEESIKLLEISVDSITAPSSPSSSVSSPSMSPQSSLTSSDRAQPKDKFKQERKRSLSKRSASQVLKGPNPPQSKRVKSQPPPDTGKPSTKKQTSSSSAQRPNTKSCHSSTSGSEKTQKNQPANQKQPSQADSSSSRAAGSSSSSVVALGSSKIPAFCHNSGKHLPASSSSSYCTHSTDSLQKLCSSSSSASSSSAASSPALSFGKNFPFAASNIDLSPPAGQQVSSSSSSLVKHPSSASSSLSSPPLSAPHKSLIPSLTLSRLLPSSSHKLLPSHANISPAHHRPWSSNMKGQHRLTYTSTSTSHNSFNSSSCYSSSPSSPSSPSTSLSPTFSSSSLHSPSSSLHSSLVSHRERSVPVSGCNSSSPGRGRKHTASASKDPA